MLKFNVRSTMMHNKKGDGLSLNVIVMAILAIIVLAVISFMLIKGTNDFGDGTSTCPGGTDNCVFTISECDDRPYVSRTCDMGGSQTGNYCCIGD